MKDFGLDLFKSNKKNTPRAFENSVTSALALLLEKQLATQVSDIAKTSTLYILFITI